MCSVELLLLFSRSHLVIKCYRMSLKSCTQIHLFGTSNGIMLSSCEAFCLKTKKSNALKNDNT